MMEKIQAMLTAITTKDEFDGALEQQTRELTREIADTEGLFQGYDMDKEEHAKEIMAWIETNQKYDFMAIQTVAPEQIDTQLIVLEKETDKFVAGRKVSIGKVEAGSATITVARMTIKDGKDPYEFGAYVREQTKSMAER